MTLFDDNNKVIIEISEMGPQGAQGPTGPTGPQGSGPTGPTGPTGPAGSGVGTQTWTANNDVVYEIHQAHGGFEVNTTASTYVSASVTVTGDYVNANSFNISVSDPTLHDALLAINAGTEYLRQIRADVYGVTRYFTLAGSLGEGGFILATMNYETSLSISNGTSFVLELYYGGAPVVWWDADALDIKQEADFWHFRGAKIDYHAYSTDSGTMIGTIYIAHDSGDHNVTHIETSSGGNDNGSVVLWKRNEADYANERRLYAYRSDGEESTTRIHWTAQVYYASEYWD